MVNEIMREAHRQVVSLNRGIDRVSLELGISPTTLRRWLDKVTDEENERENWTDEQTKKLLVEAREAAEHIKDRAEEMQTELQSWDYKRLMDALHACGALLTADDREEQGQPISDIGGDLGRLYGHDSSGHADVISALDDLIMMAGDLIDNAEAIIFD